MSRSFPSVPAGTDRFLPVRSDDERIMLCALDYGSPEAVTVNDLVHTRTTDGRQLHKSSYPKLRIAPDALATRVEAAGLVVTHHASASNGIWNTAYLELALERLSQRRGHIDRDLLAYISPALLEHVNPYGTYDFPVETEYARQGVPPIACSRGRCLKWIGNRLHAADAGVFMATRRGNDGRTVEHQTRHRRLRAAQAAGAVVGSAAGLGPRARQQRLRHDL